MLEEIEFHKDVQVRVTNSRIVIENKTYALPNILSIRVDKNKVDNKFAKTIKSILFLLAFLLTVIIVHEWGFSFYSIKMFFGFLGFYYIIKWVLTLILPVKIRHRILKDTRSSIVIETTQGEQEIFYSNKYHNYVHKVYEAIDKAIAYRGMGI